MNTKLNPLAAAIGAEVQARWRHIRRLNDSHSDLINRVVETPTPGMDDIPLSAFAHECGHLATTLAAQMTGKPQAVIEYLATKWGFEAIERHGGIVTEDMRKFQARALLGYLSAEDHVNRLLASADWVEIRAFLEPYRHLTPLVDDRP